MGATLILKCANDYPIFYIYYAEVHLSFCNYIQFMNENFERVGEWTFLRLKTKTKERGKQSGVPGEKKPDNQSENPYRIKIRGEN